MYYLKDSDLVKLIIESIQNERTQEDPNNDLNVRLHDSNISNETIYEHLSQIDFKSAQKLYMHSINQIQTNKFNFFV